MKKYVKSSRRTVRSLIAICLSFNMLLPLFGFGFGSVLASSAEDLPLAGVQASSTFRADLTTANLTDGKTETFWSSAIRQEYPAAADCDSVVLIFDGIAEVSQIGITPRQQLPKTFPRDFKLQYTVDNLTWLDIPNQSYSDYSVTTAEEIFSFEPIRAKRLRIVATRYRLDDTGHYFMQFAEVRAMGKIVEAAEEAVFGRSPITQPYAYVSGNRFVGEGVSASCDPLVNYRWENPSADDPLEIFLRRPMAVSTETPEQFEGLSSVGSDSLSLTVKGNGTLAFDFGAEFAAWLEFDSPDLSGNVTMAISEFNQPPHFPPNLPAKTATPVKYGNSYRLELNAELYEGVRFGFLTFSGVEKPFHITDVRLVCQTKPINYEGSFDSDNEMLNKIWYTAAYAVRVNLREYFSAILLDRGDRYSWTGDAYPAQAASLAAFGNFDAVLKNLRYTASHFNGFAIESYDLYWIYSVIDYYEYSGDSEGVQSLLEQVIKRLDHAYDIYGKNPSLVYFGWDERLGSGFDNPDILENQNAYKMLAIRAWKEMAPIFEDLGRDDLAEKYRGYATEKTTNLALTDVNWYQAYGLHASSDAINAGVLTGDALEEQYERYFTDRLNRLSYSPFNQYFILQAMGNAGKYDDAIASILDMWGGQIEYGGTAFFEIYRPGWNDVLGKNGALPNNQVSFTSLAHSWGSGVLPWMSEEILGIKATEAGYRTFSVTPHLGRRLTRVSGRVPTGNGVITASFDTKTGTATLFVPEGTVATIGIPKVEKTITSLKYNGQTLTVTAQDDDFIYVEGLTAGEHHFAFTYQGETPDAVDLPYEYDADYVGIDTVTKGNWGGVYGSEGYMIFGESSLQKLPDYVKEVRLSGAQVCQWMTDTHSSLALSSDPFNLGVRSLGALYSRPFSPTFAVDIVLSQKKDYTVALYFCDYDAAFEREIALQMFDLDTLEIVAPMQVVRDYSGGVYLIYRYHGSARFRIDQIRGANATLSALFFGEGSYPISDITTNETLDNFSDEISYGGANWTHVGFSGCYMDTFSNNNLRGASAELTFEGTGVTLLSSLEFNRGLAEIFIDGVSQGKIDLFAPRNETRRQVEVFHIDGLIAGTHTIKVVATGEKNRSAEGTYIEIDAFIVHNTISAATFIAEHLTLMPLRPGDSKIVIPTVPGDVTVTLVASDDEAVIDLSGTVKGKSEPKEVVLTFSVTAGDKEALCQIPVNVPAGFTPFSEGGQTASGENTYLLSSGDISAFLSSRVWEQERHDIRFVLAADMDTLAGYKELYMTVVFEDENGERIKSVTKNAVSELGFYYEAIAAGNTYRADAGCALFGLVVTDIPKDAWHTVKLSLSQEDAPDASFVGRAMLYEDLLAK